MAPPARTATTHTAGTVKFALDVDADDGSNSKEVAYVKGITGATLLQKGTFADAYQTGGNRSMRAAPTKLIDGEDDEEMAVETVGLAGATLIFALDVIGPGLVGMAFVASNSGIFPFMIFMFMSATLMVWALDLLQAAGIMAGIKNYEAVGVLSIGKKGLWFTSVAISMECYGALIGYLVLVGDTFPALFAAFGMNVPVQVTQVGVTVSCILPLTFLKNLNALEFTTWYAAGVFVIVMFTNVGNFFFDDWYVADGLNVGVAVTDEARAVLQSRGDNAFYNWDEVSDRVKACRPDPPLLLATSTEELFGNVPTLIFAMSCVPSALPVFNELEDGLLSTIKVANRVSLWGSSVLYIVAAIFGYCTTSTNTLSNNLLNMRHCVCYDFSGADCTSSCNAGAYICEDDSVWGTMINVGFGLAAVAGYSTMHYVLRRTIITVVWGETAEFSWGIHIAIAVANVAVTLLVAVLAGDVEVVFNWAGALGIPFVGFILPGMYFNIQLQGKQRFPDDPSLKRSMANVLILMGFVFMFGGVGVQLLDIFTGTRD